MKSRKTPPTRGLVGIAMHVLLCFFIFSWQAVNAASSPLDQIPSPSASSLCFAFLFAVLMAVMSAWRNPTGVDIPKNKPTKMFQPEGEEKTVQQKPECMKKDNVQEDTTTPAEKTLLQK